MSCTEGLNNEFHSAFLSLSENSQMQRIVRLIKQKLYDFLSRSCIPEWESVNCDEHNEIISLLKKGDRKACADFLKEIHWSFEKQQEHIRRFYEQASPEEGAAFRN